MTQPDPQGQVLAVRLDTLHTQHPWMDPQMGLALASSPDQTSTLLSMADGFRSTLADSLSGVTGLYSDPVLTKTPSTSLVIKRYLNSTLGSWPVADDHLTSVQKNLQAMGYGSGLPIDGVWSAAWNSTWNQAANTETAKQLQGDKPGSISTHRAAHSFLSAALPKYAFNAIIGFAKSIPGDARNLLSDVVGGVRGDVTSIGSLVTGHSPVTAMKAGVHQGSVTGASIERHLGHDISTEQYNAQTTGAAGVGRLVNDVGTILLAHSAMKAGSAVAKAAGESLTGGGQMTLREAMSGPGVVSNLLRPGATQVRSPGAIGRSLQGSGVVQRTARGAAVGSALGGGQAQVRGDNVGKGILEGAVLGGVVGGNARLSRAASSLPVLNRLGPVVGSLADADGLYYKTRTLLASPYRIPALQVAGEAATKAVGLGIAARATAATSSALTGPDDRGALAQGVQDEHSAVLDHVDDALLHATSGLTGHHFALGIDTLGWGLRGGFGTSAAERSAKGESYLRSLNTALGDIGALGALERATRMSHAQLVEKAGGEANLTLWLSHKVRAAAADHYALDTVRLMDHPPTGVDLETELAQLGHEAWTDQTILDEHTAKMMAPAGAHQFHVQLAGEISGSGTDARKWFANSLQDYLEAGKIPREILGHPEWSKFLITPLSHDAVASARADEEFTKTTGGLPAERQPALSADWLAGNNPDRPVGTVGMARNDKLLKQQALGEIDRFRARGQQIADTTPNADEQLAKTNLLLQEMAQYAELHFHLNSHQIDGLYAKVGRDRGSRLSDVDKVAQILEQRAQNLAVEVHIPPDAPAALRAKIEALGRDRTNPDGTVTQGYKLVFGTDIGHLYRHDLPPISVLTGEVTRRRAFVSKLGLNPERFHDQTVSQLTRIDVRNAIQKVLDSAKPGEVPAGYNADSVLRDLSNYKLIAPKPHEPKGIRGAAQRAAFGLSAPARARQVEFTAEEKGITLEEAETKIKAEVLGYLSSRDLPEKKVIEVLTRTHDVPWTTDLAMRNAAADEAPIPLFSDDMAQRLAAAVRAGYTKRPAYILGAGRLEDLARGGVGALGLNTPDSTILRRLDSAPNRYVQLRNIYRFGLSPMFSARRWVKTNYKASLEGVPWVVNPLKQMQETGTIKKGTALYERLYPETKLQNEYMDEADRQLRQADVLGLFNPRHFEMHAALEWQKQGKTDEEIRGLIQKAFHYGGSTEEGRTAAERTANVVFFPFSFSKTLYRNTGSYLMDHPAQALLIAQGIEAYREFNMHHLNGDNPLAASWLTEHLPLLTELNKLNAFAHGVSPGELGGINAPAFKAIPGAPAALLNFFMPQKWTADAGTGKNIQRMIPAYKDYHRITKEGGEQARIAVTAIGNSLDRGAQRIGLEKQRSRLNPLAPAITKQGQLDRAFKMIDSLETSYREVLDYNRQFTDPADKYRFGSGPSIPRELRDQPIDVSTLKRVVQRFYPAYDPTAAAAYAQAKQTRIDDFLAAHQGSAEFPKYKQFVDLARQVQGFRSRDEYDTQQLAQITAQMRHAAVDMATSSATFRKFYAKNFTSLFGPIEQLRLSYGKST